LTLTAVPGQDIADANKGTLTQVRRDDHGAFTAETVLRSVQSERTLVQDFCPLAESIEWQLGQRYWHERGNKAFLSDASPVPYLINNDGNLSTNAAHLLFASLNAAERRGTLPTEVFTLELGIGVGLFARYFLDAFRDLCLRNGKDYYDRLCYIAGDRSEQMLLDACRHGVFAKHPARYVLRVMDAREPERTLLEDLAFPRGMSRPLQAVFLNYVLDCLPPAVLEVDDSEVRQLCVRSCLARGVNLLDFTDISADQLTQRGASSNLRHERELLEIFGLFASEYAYHPVDIDLVPYGDFALRFARSTTKRLLHNYGAIQCLERLLDFTRDDGFILISDYGLTQITAADEHEHQRFSNATSIGLNFPLLKAYFGDTGKYSWIEPPTENKDIHFRLLGHEPSAETTACFVDRFRKESFDRMREPEQRARDFAKAGRFEIAATNYRQALECQPSNWALMGEIAQFLTYSLRHAKGAADMAKLALDLNPIASELWNTLGDCQFECGRVADAKQAYLQAARLNSHDARTHYNLAWVFAHEKDYAAALRQIAESLSLDWTGQYRERLLQKQGEVVARMAHGNQQEYLRHANRISTTARAAQNGTAKVGPPAKTAGVDAAADSKVSEEVKS
jgi:tetratricopeptide (TPR) repeat protein